MGFSKKLKSSVVTPIKNLENKLLPIINSINNYLDNWFPQDKWNWRKIAIEWSILQAILIGGLEIYISYLYYKQVNEVSNYIRITAVTDENKAEASIADPLKIYQMIFLVSQYYQFYLISDAVTKSSTIQLCFSTIFNIGISLYSIIQYQQAEKNKKNIMAKFLNYPGLLHKSKNFEIAIMVLMAVFCVGWIIITLRLYKVFGWNVFKQLGADIGVKNRLRLYQILLTLLKIDIFLFSTFTFQFVIFVVYYIFDNQKVKYMNIVFLVIVFIMPFIGFRATKKENYRLMLIYIIFLSVSIGYMTFSLVQIIVDNKEAEKNLKPSSYRNCSRSLSFSCISSIIIGILTFILTLVNFKNFPKGLRKDKTIRQQTNSQHTMSSTSYNTPKRWSIE